MEPTVKDMISTLNIKAEEEAAENSPMEPSEERSASPPHPDLSISLTPPPSPTEDKTVIKREHAKMYQREYRQRQKSQLQTLKESQIRGAEILLVAGETGTITSKVLKTEADYLDMLEGFLQALRDSKYLMSYRLTKI